MGLLIDGAMQHAAQAGRQFKARCLWWGYRAAEVGKHIAAHGASRPWPLP
jgi:hypothetical protein